MAVAGNGGAAQQDREETAGYRQFPADIPFVREMGVEFLGMDKGEASVALTLTAHHMNSWQVAHGGVSLTLLDVAMAMATRSLDERAQAGVTVEMKTSFLQAGGKPGDRLVSRGKVFHRSTTMCFCEAELWNADKLVAKAMGTFKMLKRLDTARRVRAAEDANN